jgi:hypothetical protein
MVNHNFFSFASQINYIIYLASIPIMRKRMQIDTFILFSLAIDESMHVPCNVTWLNEWMDGGRATDKTDSMCKLQYSPPSTERRDTCEVLRTCRPEAPTRRTTHPCVSAGWLGLDMHGHIWRCRLRRAQSCWLAGFGACPVSGRLAGKGSA